MPKSSVTNSILFRRVNIQKLTRVAKEPHITFGKSAVGRSVKRLLKGEARKFVEHIKKPKLEDYLVRIPSTIADKEGWKKTYKRMRPTSGKFTKQQIRADVDLVMRHGPGAIGGVTQILKRMGILRGVQKPVKFAKPVIRGTPEELAVEIVKHGGKTTKGKKIFGFYASGTNQVAVTSAKESRKLLIDARQVPLHETLHGYMRRELGIARSGLVKGDPAPSEKAFQNIRDLFKGARVSKEWMRGGPESYLPLKVEERVVDNLVRKMLKQPRKKRKLK